MIKTVISNYRTALMTAIAAIDVAQVEKLAEQILLAYACKRRIFIIGNGGSAATASHMACDLQKSTLAAHKDHSILGGNQPLPQIERINAVSLMDNMALMTAWGNDVSYESALGEMLRAQAGEGDLLIAISASGNSPNIRAAIDVAEELHMFTAGLLGFGGGAAFQMVDHAVVIESHDYGVVEDCHGIVMHMLTEYLKSQVRP